MIVFAGGNSTNILIQDWNDQSKLKKIFKDGGEMPFIEKALQIDQHPSAYDFSLFLSETQQDDKNTH